MTEKKAIKKSIKHWKRMIKWVKRKYKMTDEPNINMMLMELGESWLGDFCPLCETFNVGVHCKNCPLAKKYGDCGNSMSKNNYKNVYKAKTWGEWLKESEIMLEQLRSLL